jgi:hypothetical protein
MSIEERISREFSKEKRHVVVIALGRVCHLATDKEVTRVFFYYIPLVLSMKTTSRPSSENDLNTFSLILKKTLTGRGLGPETFLEGPYLVLEV